MRYKKQWRARATSVRTAHYLANRMRQMGTPSPTYPIHAHVTWSETDPSTPWEQNGRPIRVDVDSPDMAREMAAGLLAWADAVDADRANLKARAESMASLYDQPKES
jgi:hypothetical protein